MALSKKLGKRSLGGSSVQISNAMGSDLWDRSCSLGSSVLGVKKKTKLQGEEEVVTKTTHLHLDHQVVISNISQSMKAYQTGTHRKRFINPFPLILLKAPLMYILKMNHLQACAGCLLGSQEETLPKASGWTRLVWLWER